MLIRNGYNVYPREVEEVIYQIPEIKEVAVFGLPDKEVGEEVAALIVLNNGEKIEISTIQDYVKSQLAPYKYPRIIKILDEMPRGPLGKLSKKYLIEHFASL